MTKIDFKRAFSHILPNAQPGRNMYLKITNVTAWNNNVKSSITIELFLINELKGKYLIADVYLNKNRYWNLKPLLIID